jgi:hypothetical protein
MTSTRRTLSRRTLIVLTAIILTMVTTGTVLAQATANFDLGCRAVLSSGGGTMVHGATTSIGVLGQWAPGTITASSTGVSGGYLQPVPAQSTAAALVSTPSADTQTEELFLPLVRSFTRLVRGCTY